MIPVQLNCESDSFRHYWCPESEPYAPAEVLLYFLGENWRIDEPVVVKRVYHTRGRYSEVYYFILTRRDEIVYMPVIGSPAIVRVLAAYQVPWTDANDSLSLESGAGEISPGNPWEWHSKMRTGLTRAG